MSLLLNRAKETTATTGTGTVTLGGAVVPFQTWAAAQSGTSTGRRYSYLIEDGNAWEIGEGIFNESANTVTRNLVASSTGALLNLSGSATVACVEKAADIPQVIEKKSFTGVETSFQFADIPQDFNTLELEIFGRVASASTAVLTVNGLSTAIYDRQRQYAIGTTNTADENLAQTSMGICAMVPNTYPAGQANGGVWRLPGYSQTTLHKMLEGMVRWAGTSTTTYNGYAMKMTGGIRTTGAITQIDITMTGGALLAGSYAVLRGIP